MGNHGWLRCYRGSRSHVNITFIMEEEHGNNTSVDRLNNSDPIDRIRSDRVRKDMELDMEKNKKPRPSMRRIVTDCC